MTLLLGYIGPGAGLGLIGSLLAIVAVVAVGLLGLVLYPLKLAVSWYRAPSAADPGDESMPHQPQTAALKSLTGTQATCTPVRSRS